MHLKIERRLLMENNRIVSAHRMLRLCFLIFVMLSFIANIIGYNYINELESQVSQRDSVISKLSYSNSLVKEYFDVVEDSINNQTIYKLKDEKKEKVVETKTKYVEHQVEIEHQFVRGDKIISTEELLSIVNKGDSVMLNKVKSLLDRYNSLVNDYNIIQKKAQLLKDTVIYQGMALRLIKKNYDIDYSCELDNNSYYVRLHSSKADSAFTLFPYFRHKMKYDETKKTWAIRK